MAQEAVVALEKYKTMKTREKLSMMVDLKANAPAISH